jgi:hypothetical protein
MCPVCIATALLIAGKVAATGGVAAIAIKRPGGNNAVDFFRANRLGLFEKTKEK